MDFKRDDSQSEVFYYALLVQRPGLGVGLSGQ